MKKLAFVSSIAAVILAFFIFDIDQYFTLDGIKASQLQVDQWRSNSPLIVVLAFALLSAMGFCYERKRSDFPH